VEGTARIAEVDRGSNRTEGAGERPAYVVRRGGSGKADKRGSEVGTV
jgi:hypothetical protein